jgi:S1-C subfamily serine protease
MALASGFWINDAGYIATCWHVVRDAPNATFLVRTPIDSRFDSGGMSHANWVVFNAIVVAKNEETDVAILKVVAPSSPPVFSARGSQVQTVFGAAHARVAILRDKLPEIGSSAAVVGFPLGEPYQVVQPGSIASIAFNLTHWGPTVKVLVSTVANPGNSGGAVLDDQGNVVGLLEGALPSRPGLDPAQAVSGLAIVVPVHALSGLANRSHIQISIKKGK